MKTGYDALEMPHGKKQDIALGYEKPQTGPTTNFVGNHMTQGAIDLVQAQLDKQDAAYQMLKLKAYNDRFSAPKLLSVSTSPNTDLAGALVSLEKKQSRVCNRIDHYKWWDDGSAIAITVPSPCNDISFCKGSCDIVFEATDSSFRLEVRQHILREVGGKDEPVCNSWTLGVQRLFGAIDPDACSYKHSGKSLSLRLAKLDNSFPWESLSRPNEARVTSRAAPHAHGPDLVSLRKLVRAQRKDLAHIGAFAAPSEAAGFQDPAAGDGTDVAWPEFDLPDMKHAMEEAEELERIGNHAKAAQVYRWALDCFSSEDSQLGDLHLHLGTCQLHLGKMKEAAEEFQTAASVAKELGTKIRALLQGAAALEQLERLEEASVNFKKVLSLEPSSSEASKGLARVAKAMKLSELARAGEEPMDNFVPPSVPRPCLPAFRNRGKSGKPF